jgi:hypothetical protein
MAHLPGPPPWPLSTFPPVAFPPHHKSLLTKSSSLGGGGSGDGDGGAGGDGGCGSIIMFSSSSWGKGNLRVDSISSMGGSALTGVGEIRDSWAKDEEGELINEPVRILKM